MPDEHEPDAGKHVHGERQDMPEHDGHEHHGHDFPAMELALAATLGVVLRLIYLVGGSGRDPMFHVEAAIGITPGSWPLPPPRIVQILLDCATMVLTGRTAHIIWGRRAGIFAAIAAGLYGPLVYFQGESFRATAAVCVASATLFLSVRLWRGRPVLELVLAALAAAAAFALTGGRPAVSEPFPPGTHSYLERIALVWNQREIPFGLDQQFFGPFRSWLFRLPWLVSFWFVAPVAIVAAWMERRRAQPLIVYCAVLTLLVALGPVTDRARVPLVVGLFPFVGFALDRFLRVIDDAVHAVHAGYPLGATLADAVRERRLFLVGLAVAAAAVVLPFPALRATQTGPSWHRLARGYESTGRSELAAAAYLKAEALGDRSIDFYRDWGFFDLAHNRLVPAEHHFAFVIGVSSRDARSHQGLAEIYDRRASFDLAAQEYAILAGLDRARAAQHFTSAGGMLEEAGNRDGAADMFRRALGADPSYGPAQEGLQRMERPLQKRLPVKLFPPVSQPANASVDPAAGAPAGAAPPVSPEDSASVNPPSGR